MAKGPGTVLPLPDGSPERLTGGYKNELLRYGDVVLRLEQTTPESAEWEHDLLHELSRRVPLIVVPIGRLEPRDDGRIGTLLPYVPGGQLDRDDPKQRAAVAGFLAHLHHAGLAWRGGQRPQAFSWPDRPLVRNAWWDWEIVEKPAVLVRAYEEMCAFLADPPPLTTTVVHGDVYRGNMRVLDGCLVGVIDWEEARLDWPAWELANATWELCKLGDGLDRRRAGEFMERYVELGGPGEPEHLDTMIRLRSTADVLYSLTSKARGEPFGQEYIDHLLRALA